MCARFVYCTDRLDRSFKLLAASIKKEKKTTSTDRILFIIIIAIMTCERNYEINNKNNGDDYN